jgi:hypothetical protein
LGKIYRALTTWLTLEIRSLLNTQKKPVAGKAEGFLAAGKLKVQLLPPPGPIACGPITQQQLTRVCQAVRYAVSSSSVGWP